MVRSRVEETAGLARSGTGPPARCGPGAQAVRKSTAVIVDRHGPDNPLMVDRLIIHSPTQRCRASLLGTARRKRVAQGLVPFSVPPGMIDNALPPAHNRAQRIC